MNLAAKLKLYLSQPTNLYFIGLSTLGAMTFITQFEFEVLNSVNWVKLYSLIGAILLLYFVIFRLPPKGNSQSMDSTIYLACIFYFGLQIPLAVLLFSSIAYAIFVRKTKLWNHIANFSSYCLMITAAFYSFVGLGGQVGALNTDHIYSYIMALVVYFAINVTSLGLFFVISIKQKLFEILRDTKNEIITTFLSTLVFSLILTIMFQTHFYFGLFLFLIIGVFLSMSFRKLFELFEEVSAKAIRDQRTGLYNHGYFEELLENELVKAKATQSPLSLAMLDVDSFKKYNDTFGHLQGDKLLEFFGKLLLTECEPHKYIAGRHGGDEFTILMPGMTEKEAFAFINALRKKVNDSYFEGVEILPHGCISFSAGIIEYRKEIYDKSQLLDRADQAMYYAKAQGKNVVHIFSEQSHIKKLIDIEQDILDIEQQLKIFLSKDVYTFQHSKRVFGYAIEICNYIPLTDSERRTLILGALFHDIGKLEVPKYILQKKEKLTPEEWSTVKKHVEWGKDIVAAIGKYDDLIPLVELHHERVDGKGYPHGLKGEEIPKLARILCVIDSFDAMTTERPYQKTKTFDEAIAELRRCAGEQFDSEFVDYFISMIHTKYDFKLEAAAAMDAELDREEAFE
ncbi:diguanylate cyclase [Paenibacillus sediminis]|uniref:Diguanylate cyclase (GGDEF)-like protein/putative nucleotidyltransferase with HDIG domain n=1 Tax=Paenibacillus sediminis TaxID=664909 RepID=A0ABS4H2N1_9BACL|nr:diguanylate cyclase [Paenibacillus sediminis]MBP1936789.1 diguanylate cyclase (GGDEF)-like protein/putative nucleotidyltransferase with HDIG domain [Paenibacillus sediminis]